MTDALLDLAAAFQTFEEKAIRCAKSRGNLYKEKSGSDELAHQLPWHQMPWLTHAIHPRNAASN